MKKSAAFLIFCWSFTVFASTTVVFENSSTRVELFISGTEDNSISDFTRIPAFEYENEIVITIYLTDKATGETLNMPIFLNDFRDYLEVKKTNVPSGSTKDRNIQLFKNLIKDMNVTPVETE